jgi:hypothetical protein
MSDVRVETAKKSARVIYALIGANVVVLLVLWPLFGLVHSSPREGIADAIGLFWLLLFISIPILSVVWLVRFGSLTATTNALRTTWWIILSVVVIWILIVAAVIALYAYIARSLIGFL